MVRVIEELKPGLVIGENVSGFIKMGLDKAISDLESLGYSTAAISIPACAVDAPHIRQRVFIVANTERGNDKELKLQLGTMQEESRKTSKRLGYGYEHQDGRWPVESGILRVSNGVPSRVDRLKCLGNAVVPQVSYQIGLLIKEWLNDTENTN